MGRKLIITEKPSVARDFARVLGVSGRADGYIENREYVITWCVGHLVEMLYPESYDPKYKKWKVEDLPFLPEEYKYGIIENVAKQYGIVHGFLQSPDIDTVYWAGDSGKEGQTIEENIRNFGGVREGMEELRVWIDSQTDDEIKRGIREAKPMSAYANLGKSGIMRSIEDYALGINFSRVLSVKYGALINKAAVTSKYTAIAVGRVMTCVLGMIVNREREIRNFTDTPFYRVFGNFMDMKLPCEWRSTEKSKFYNSPLLYKENGFKSKEGAGKLIAYVSGRDIADIGDSTEALVSAPDTSAVIDTVEKSISKKKAPLLFNLAELQAECAKLFKISPDETLAVAQELYEKKLTTYPRTDARVLTKAVAGEIQKNLSGLNGFGKTSEFSKRILEKGLYKGLASTQYVDDSKVTDHYAIIPTGQTAEISNLSELSAKVYELIVRRFLSIFYPPAQYLSVKLVFKIFEESFFISTKVLKEKGYLEISGVPKDNKAKGEKNPSDGDDEEEEVFDKQALVALADTLKKGDTVSVDSFYTKEGKTSPPKRYTSGTIILAMENAGNLIEDEELRAQIKTTGIGTSATRAEIIKKLINNQYLNLNKKTQVLTPENLGEMIYEVVTMTVPSLLNPKMTASWEKGLEGITRGEVDVADYRAKLEEFIASETKKMAGENITQPLAERISQFAGKGATGLGSRRRLGLTCPDCGGELTTTSFGYGCSNYTREEAPCRFAIGKIAGVVPSEEDVRELITNKRTKVIGGFVGKSKKKFRAALVLTQNEEGKNVISFDFSDSTPEAVPGVKCPSCGGDIVKTMYGFRCVNYVRQPQDMSTEEDSAPSCNFSLGKICGKDISESNLKELINKGITPLIKGFKSKNGKKFNAKLELKKDEAQAVSIGFVFEESQPKVMEGLKCPMCGGELIQTRLGCMCVNYTRSTEPKEEGKTECHFSIGKIASKSLSEEQIRELLTQEKTSVIDEFVSKTGMFFSARLTLARDETGKVTGIKFLFEN